MDSILGWGTKIPHAASCDQKKKRERERHSNYVLTERLVKLPPTVMWEMESVPKGLVDLAKKISRKSGVSSSWLLYLSTWKVKWDKEKWKVRWAKEELLIFFSHLFQFIPPGGLQVALMVKNSPAKAGDKRCRFSPLVGKILWRRGYNPL